MDKAVEVLSKQGIYTKIIYTKPANKAIDNYNIARIVRCNFTDQNTVTLVAAFFREKSKGYPVGD